MIINNKNILKGKWALACKSNKQFPARFPSAYCCYVHCKYKKKTKIHVEEKVLLGLVCELGGV